MGIILVIIAGVLMLPFLAIIGGIGIATFLVYVLVADHREHGS